MKTILKIGLQWTLAGFWMDPAFRLAHSLEVLADAMLYMAVLVLLFTAVPFYGAAAPLLKEA